jgi:hypothetical protein
MPAHSQPAMGRGAGTGPRERAHTGGGSEGASNVGMGIAAIDEEDNENGIHFQVQPAGADGPVKVAALLTIGVWIGLLAASWAMASASFRTVDRLLGPHARPELQARLAAVPAEDRRAVLRHVAAESNRWMFRAWSLAEIVLALLLVVVSWRMGTALRALALVAGAAVLIQAAGLGPAILALGRSIDFVPRPLPTADGRRFGLLHAGYMLADLVKAGVLVAAAAVIARRGA